MATQDLWPRDGAGTPLDTPRNESPSSDRTIAAFRTCPWLQAESDATRPASGAEDLDVSVAQVVELDGAPSKGREQPNTVGADFEPDHSGYHDAE